MSLGACPSSNVRPHFVLGEFGLTCVGCLWVCWLVSVRDVERWWSLKRAGIWHRLRGDGAYPTDAVHAGTNSPPHSAMRHRECAFV